MISHKHKFVFIHIPKTGGQSISDVLLKQHGMRWSLQGAIDGKFREFLIGPRKDNELGPEQLTHLTAEEYLKFGYLDKDRFKNYFKFSFVRNPWKRLVSEYFFYGYNNKKSFDNFIKNEVWKVRFNKTHNDKQRHLELQYNFLFDKNDNCLVDFIGRSENLQKDFDKICDRIEIERVQLLRIGKIKHDSYIKYYNDQTKEIVAKKYKKDIEYFDYNLSELTKNNYE